MPLIGAATSPQHLHSQFTVQYRDAAAEGFRHLFDQLVAEGMYYSVVCAEDADIDVAAVPLDGLRPDIAATTADELRTIVETCTRWQVQALPASVDDPVVSDIPTLPLPYSRQDEPLERITPLDGPAAMFAQRRAMQRAQQRPAPGPHTGLGLPAYVQATSPLRRYGDLLVHQQLRAHLAGAPLLDANELTLRLGTADAVSGAVRTAERLSNAHWTMVYLLQNPDWTGEGVVIENKPGRDLVLIPALAWETELYGRRPRPLNSPVALALESVDLPQRTARFVAQDSYPVSLATGGKI